MRPIHIFLEFFFSILIEVCFFYSRSAQYQWLWNGVCFMVFTNRIGLQFKCSSGWLPLCTQYMNFWHIWCIRIMQKSGAKHKHTHTTERWYRRGRGKQKNYIQVNRPLEYEPYYVSTPSIFIRTVGWNAPSSIFWSHFALDCFGMCASFFQLLHFLCNENFSHTQTARRIKYLDSNDNNNITSPYINCQKDGY